MGDTRVPLRAQGGVAGYGLTILADFFDGRGDFFDDIDPGCTRVLSNFTCPLGGHDNVMGR